MPFWRRTLPLGITCVLGVAGAAQYYVPHPASERLLTEMSEWLRIVSGFGMILAIVSLGHVHWARIRRREAGWGYSGVVFVAMLATVIVGVAAGGKEQGTALGWIYTAVLLALQGTMFSILAFFVASAAYRAFRARTPEATVLLSAATLVMFGRVPLGEYLVGGVGKLADWVLGVVNTAARRGIILGISLGGIATSVKIIFGIERAYLGGRE